MNHNCSRFTNTPPLPCFTFSILFFIDGLRLGWWWRWRLVVGVFAASACSDHSFVSMQMYFSFNLVPQLIVFTASHITPKKLNLLDSEKKYMCGSHNLIQYSQDCCLRKNFKEPTRSNAMKLGTFSWAPQTTRLLLGSSLSLSKRDLIQYNKYLLFS